MKECAVTHGLLPSHNLQHAPVYIAQISAGAGGSTNGIYAQKNAMNKKLLPHEHGTGHIEEVSKPFDLV